MDEINKQLQKVFKIGSPWHEEHLSKSTKGEILSDKVANLMGSWKFIIVQTLVIILWASFNIIGYIYHFDPYPFIFLNLLLSLMSTYAAPVIMMAQNRQGARDREQSMSDYITNTEAKKEIEEIQERLSRIETEKLDKIIMLLEKKYE